MKVKFELIVKYLRGDASLEERLEIMEWAKADESNMQELMAFRKIYDAMLLSDEAFVQKKKGTRRVLRWVGSIAAAIALGVGLWFMTGERDEEEYLLATLTAPYGEQTRTELADGTVVRLNSGSRLEIYEGDKSQRKVRLEGEAYFDVSRDEDRPFILQTPGMEVKVLGTEFNVTAYNELQSVVLVEGSVEVKGMNQEEAVRMEPSQRFVYDLNSGASLVEKIDVEEYVSWTEGYICLKHETVSQVIERLGNYYGVEIIWRGEDPEDFTLTGKLVINDGLDAALNTLSLMLPIKSERLTDGRIILMTEGNGNSL